MRGPPRQRLHGAAWVILTLGLLGACWWSPRSPIALERGNVLLGRGLVANAAAHFDAVAHYNPLQSLRYRAALRAAALWSVELNDPVHSKAVLEQLVADEQVPAEVRAKAAADVGYLLLNALDDAPAAAASLKQAYELDPKATDAAARLAAAARAEELAGATDDAHRSWAVVTRHFPERKAEARINQAAILLSKGQLSQALEAYEDAIASARDETELNIARLGAAACRERQQRIEAALAQLEAADLDEATLEMRGRDLQNLGDMPTDDL